MPLASAAFELEQQWTVNGIHYSKTLEAWLKRQDAAKKDLLPILEKTYGAETEIWFQRWRMFWMASSELFKYRKGNEWPVHHYLLRKKGLS